MNQIIIPLPLPSMNEYSNAQRTHKHAGARMKREATQICALYARQAMNKGFTLTTPCKLKFTWILPDKRKDADNVASAKKFVLDGFQKVGLIKNDNLNHITGFTDVFVIDKNSKSVVIIEEE